MRDVDEQLGIRRTSRIREHMERLGISTGKQLADLIGTQSYNAVNRLINSPKIPSGAYWGTLVALARVFKCKVDDLEYIE